MSVNTLEYEHVKVRDPKQCIIWLHGLGADGFNFMSLVPMLNMPHAEFIFPHAPVRPITINMGMRMRGWYDIYALDRLDREDEEGIKASCEAINVLIDEAIARGFESKDIILVGFSQGGVMTLYTGLTCKHRLGALIGLSCYLPLASQILAQPEPVNHQTPVFMAHGRQDTILPIALAEHSVAQLIEAGYNVSWHPYQMEHLICDKEVVDLKQFIAEHIAL